MNTNETTSERRNFLVQSGTLLGVGLFAGSISNFLESCTNSTAPVVQQQINVTQYPELQNDFGAKKIKFSGLNQNFPVLVIRKSATSFVALSTICAHQGNEVNLPDPVTKTITCPVHGSQYNEIDGSLKLGPATHGLQQFPTTFDAATNILTISIS